MSGRGVPSSSRPCSHSEGDFWWRMASGKRPIDLKFLVEMDFRNAARLSRHFFVTWTLSGLTIPLAL